MASAARADLVPRSEVVSVVGATAFVWLFFSHLAVLVPLRLLVTLVHEASHAIAAMVSGLGVLSVTVNRHGGGLTHWRGADVGEGTVLLVASAGYVGTAVTGALMLECSRRLRSGRVALVGLAVLITAVGLAWVPWRTDPDPLARAAAGSTSGDGRFTVLVCVLAVVALLGLAVQPMTRVRRAAVMVLATCLCLGAVADLQQVLEISRRGGHSDAAIAATVSPLSSWMWAVAWLAMGAIVCAAAAWSVIDKEGPTAPARLTPATTRP